MIKGYMKMLSCLVIMEDQRKEIGLKSEIVAFKYKMSSIQAAMGIAQVKRLKIILKKRKYF